MSILICTQFNLGKLEWKINEFEANSFQNLDWFQMNDLELKPDIERSWDI